MSKYSRGKFILSLLQFNKNNNNLNDNDEEDPVSSVSKESSPAPSLTELKAWDPEFVNNTLSEDFGRGNPDQHNEDLFKLYVEDQLEEHGEVHFECADAHFEHEEHHIFDPEAENQILLMPTRGPEDRVLFIEEAVTEHQNVFEDNQGSGFEIKLLQDNDIDDPTFVPGTTSDSESSSHGSFVGACDVRPREVFNPVSLVPYTDSDDSEDYGSTEAQNNKKGKKRMKNEKNWKKNVRKKKRLSGKEYINTKNFVIKAKSLKPPCHANCRLKCNLRFSEEQRLKIHSEYWDAERTWDSKRQFVVSSIKTKPVVRQRIRDGSRKSKTESHTFFFTIHHKEEIVCKTFFLNTLSISETFMRVALKKASESGLMTPDLRGKHIPANKLPSDSLEGIKSHISKFPVYQSHYRERSKREYLGNHLNISIMHSIYVNECFKNNIKPEKKWVYSKVFNEDFNLSFHLPDNDTCDVCDQLDCQIKSEKNDGKLDELKLQKGNHLKEASLRYDLKREDKVKSCATEGCRVVMSDLQKCLPAPDLKNSQSFYSRKLWILNSTIYDATVDKTWCMIWDETTAGRGGNEIASCLFTWAHEELKNPQKPVENLTVWIDNCSGQNRNINMVFMYLWLLEKVPTLKEVNHKFLLAGHTHMEVDGKHSVIERAKNKIKNTIFTTNDWANFIASCSKKNPFIVRRMLLEDFLDFLYLRNKDAPFISRKKNDDNEPFLISHAVWLQLRQDDTKLYYKTSFTEDNFKTVDLKRKRRERGIVLPASIPPMRLTKRKISNEKYRDLMNLLQWVPEEYRSFFEKIPHGEMEGNFPEDDSTALD